MGCFGSKDEPAIVTSAADVEEVKKNVVIDKELKSDAESDKKVRKLLLLGPGESGKSTFFKQMTISHRGGFNDEQKAEFASSIRLNMVTYIWELGRGCASLGLELEPDHAELVNNCESLMSAYSMCTSDPSFAEKAKSFWAHPSAQSAWVKRSQIQVSESLGYFMTRIDDIVSDSYVPNDQDILRLRVRTTGVLQEDFVIKTEKFTLIDVGGQRSERRKWIQFFNSVTAVLFVAAIGEYDQTIFEDRKTNRIQEALSLFEENVNLEVFELTTFVLFLNKDDIFRDKLTKVPLKVCFPEYTGSQEYDDAARFVEEQFLSRVRGAKTRIYVHFTCATDTEKTKALFYAVRDTVIRAGLGNAGLL